MKRKMKLGFSGFTAHRGRRNPELWVFGVTQIQAGMFWWDGDNGAPRGGERSPPLGGVIFPTTRGQCWVGQENAAAMLAACSRQSRWRAPAGCGDWAAWGVWWSEPVSWPRGGRLSPRGCPCPGERFQGGWLSPLRAAARPAVSGRPPAVGVADDRLEAGWAAAVRSRKSRVRQRRAKRWKRKVDAGS